MRSARRCRVNDIPGDHRTETVRLLNIVGLSATDVEKYPFQFSGGQRQRVAIARALAVRPEVLVCDEATSALDVSVQASVLNLLRDIRRESGLALAVVSHNLDVLRYLCDDIAVMRQGVVVENRPAEDLFRDPHDPSRGCWLDAVPRFSVTAGNRPGDGRMIDERAIAEHFPDRPRGYFDHAGGEHGPGRGGVGRRRGRAPLSVAGRAVRRTGMSSRMDVSVLLADELGVVADRGLACWRTPARRSTPWPVRSPFVDGDEVIRARR